MSKLSYQREDQLDPEEFRQLLIDSTLGERRPVNDPTRIKNMVRFGNLIITCREGELLVGVARSLTDFAFCTYLSDLAVRKSYQHKGIGTELIRETKRLTPLAKLILLSAPAAVDFYPKIGMRRHEQCYYIDSIDELRQDRSKKSK
ncbi:MAG TPA: GNAT family N-acetyltransferase [Bacteroidota bacterium]|nr:GNAT family N-acetyltransferase [Bacteroidota bacterium]